MPSVRTTATKVANRSNDWKRGALAAGSAAGKLGFFKLSILAQNPVGQIF
jgi:hypothetical protein